MASLKLPTPTEPPIFTFTASMNGAGDTANKLMPFNKLINFRMFVDNYRIK